jgi:DNA (cytosine-5)-methyltransferase 1
MSFSYDSLWKLLAEKHLSKTDFARRVGITSATLAKLGKNQNVNMDVLHKICKYLECDLADIMTHSPETSIKVVSLFSGIGGFEAGLEKSNLNGRVVFASEIDDKASKSYAANFSNVDLYGDITKIAEQSVPDHDLLVGGFPCQAFSIAGRRNGFEDTRGTLFFDVARIAEHKKPKFILLENVKNLISHDNSNTINVILSTLSSLGYTTDFTVINSKEAGLPQSRERTYILGIRDFPAEKFEIDRRNKKATSIKMLLNQNNIFQALYFLF